MALYPNALHGRGKAVIVARVVKEWYVVPKAVPSYRYHLSIQFNPGNFVRVHVRLHVERIKSAVGSDAVYCQFQTVPRPCDFEVTVGLL
jgi:hypothetical protein